MKISDLLLSLKACYTVAQNTDYQENQKLFVEMGWAIRRLIERKQLTYFDNFNNDEIKQLVFDEMNWDINAYN